MPSSAGIGAYLRRAFGFRPFGMLFPPHLAGVAIFGLLGILNPGFWLIGLGFEGLYLLAMVTHPRFRALVDREIEGRPSEAAVEAAVEEALRKLSPADQARFRHLRERCDELAGAAEHEADALAGLLQVHLGLLGAQTALARLVATADGTVAQRLSDATLRLADPDLDPELRRSLEGQRTLLAQRSDTQDEAERQHAYVQAELQRVEDQVALLREQAALAANASSTEADRVDAIAGAIAETRRWLDAQPNLEGAERAPLPAIRARRAGAEKSG